MYEYFVAHGHMASLLSSSPLSQDLQLISSMALGPMLALARRRRIVALRAQRRASFDERLSIEGRRKLDTRITRGALQHPRASPSYFLFRSGCDQSTIASLNKLNAMLPNICYRRCRLLSWHNLLNALNTEDKFHLLRRPEIVGYNQSFDRKPGSVHVVHICHRGTTA